MTSIKKYTIPFIASLFILFVLAYILVNWMKGDASTPKTNLPSIESCKLADLTCLNPNLKMKLSLVYSLLQDTLTDAEEGRLIALITESKTDSSLNDLILKLDASGLLAQCIVRWDEEAMMGAAIQRGEMSHGESYIIMIYNTLGRFLFPRFSLNLG